MCTTLSIALAEVHISHDHFMNGGSQPLDIKVTN